MPCAAQTNKSLHASLLLAAKSRLSAKLPVPIGKSYRRNVCRVSASALHAVEKAQAQSKTRPEYIPGRIEDPNYVRIFDTTLRDGEQSPGASMQTSISFLAPMRVCISRSTFGAIQVLLLPARKSLTSPGSYPSLEWTSSRQASRLHPQTISKLSVALQWMSAMQ